MPTAPVVCVVGRPKSGRTTLIEKLVRELKQRGLSGWRLSPGFRERGELLLIRPCRRLEQNNPSLIDIVHVHLTP
jgi:molybdopterin-guanine dinucleotide biosynthesis protein